VSSLPGDRDPFERLARALPKHSPDLVAQSRHEPDVDAPALGLLFEALDDVAYPVRVLSLQPCSFRSCPKWWPEVFWWCGGLPLVEHLHTRRPSLSPRPGCCPRDARRPPASQPGAFAFARRGG
jgi:hypothetical protein